MSAALERFSKHYTFKRYAPQVVTKGKLVQPTEILNDGQPWTMEASIQRLNGREVLLLPEGYRNRSGVKVFTTTALKPANEKKGTLGDRFTWKDDLYEVMELDDWTDGPIEHDKFLAFEVENA